ncbi:MAG: hypothetical protein Q9162_003015 [Coniocarpon cinnabarinum]
MSLEGQLIAVTGASMGIGAAVAKAVAHAGADVVLMARTEEKLDDVAKDIQKTLAVAKKPLVSVLTSIVDVRDYSSVETAMHSARTYFRNKPIDVLVNNAGLALGAPSMFPKMKLPDITQMTDTNINGVMHAAYSVLNAGGMLERKRGTILNVTSTTGLEVPPFAGEAVYHASKACQEAFTNALRTELRDTNIRVLALRPGVVATHFHQQRVSYNEEMYQKFIAGYEPLIADEVAENAVWMLSRNEKVSVKALDVVPTAQRSLQVFRSGMG